jgi:hypothetical protein
MTEIELTPTEFVVHLRGIDRFLAWRRQVVVPLKQVRGATPGIAPDVRLVRGAYVRWPASDVQGRLKVGTFLVLRPRGRLRDATRLFYNTRGGEKAITIRLAGARYTAIVVEVADPAATVAAINAAARARDDQAASTTRPEDEEGQ